jgi:hypothetical protein
LPFSRLPAPFNGGIRDKSLTRRVYPGADGRFVLYEDDGAMRLEMRWTEATRQLRLSLAPGSKMFRAATRELAIEITGASARQTVKFSGAPRVVRL